LKHASLYFRIYHNNDQFLMLLMEVGFSSYFPFFTC
jgi:hypothetical protein